ncbi:MAG: threonylcarbamoyl-AMP synthase [Candidatus Marinimicrobia bacterium CG08_land_8_20_14_0_20_45_22]|nr:MAG: threonylcarbamoyl-AMP synthase [Candidatus Marinimicrobia bacterium CG08_land_8_20_14_0_20_45_22]
MTEIISIDSASESQIAAILSALSDGQIIAYPTDTICGLGVDVFNSSAVGNLIRLKGRSSQKAISILYSDVERLLKDFPNLNNYQRKSVRSLIPGRVTLVLPVKNRNFPEQFMDEGFVGVRVIDMEPLNRILRQFPNPITTTSANPSGEKPAENAEDVVRYFGNSVSIVLKSSDSSSQIPSTVVRILSDSFSILRAGAVSADEIAQRCE